MAIERQKLIHLHTPEVKAPAVGSLELGEIAVQHNATEAALYIEKSNSEIAKFIDVTAIDAKIKVETLRAKGAEEALAEKIEALEGSNHTHENKGVLDGITAEKVAAWDAAEGNAKADAEAKYQIKGDYEAAGAAAAVEGKLDAHKEDSVMHITDAERTDWNAAKSAIDAFLKDADMTEKAVDTLAELQTYMTTDGEAATKLIERVSALEEIDHNAYVSADTQVLADAKAYVDGKVDGKFDEAGAAAQALADAKADAEGKYQVKGDYEAAGAAAQALADAKADAASLYQPKGEYEAAGAAAAAESAAKTYTDNAILALKIDCGTY